MAMEIILKIYAWREKRKITLIFMSWSVEASPSCQPKTNSSLSHSLPTSAQLYPFSLQGDCLWCTVSTKTRHPTAGDALPNWGYCWAASTLRLFYLFHRCHRAVAGGRWFLTTCNPPHLIETQVLILQLQTRRILEHFRFSIALVFSLHLAQSKDQNLSC